jgi:Fur family ferric uptake transcriptional regulator
MDLSTAYRNVQKLTDSGALTEVHVHGKKTYYERADREHHDHLICDRCTATSCVPCPVAALTDPHSLELYGLCARCAA